MSIVSYSWPYNTHLSLQLSCIVGKFSSLILLAGLYDIFKRCWRWFVSFESKTKQQAVPAFVDHSSLLIRLIMNMMIIMTSMMMTALAWIICLTRHCSKNHIDHDYALGRLLINYIDDNGSIMVDHPCNIFIKLSIYYVEDYGSTQSGLSV